jgi:hypothetical protein
MSVGTILKSQFPADVVDALLDAYKEVESNFVLGKWKASELDAGHFVEAGRRCIESQLIPPHTPIADPISKFTDQVMKQYENAQGDESLRMHIPRVLRSIYNIRNKRGVGHLGPISPNEMDSTLILYSTKWVLAELLRLSGGGSPAATQAAVEQVIERRISGLWKHSGPTRVLVATMKTSDQCLLLLYDKNAQSWTDLKDATEYKNAANFRKLLRGLHAKRLIELASDGVCTISPLGIVASERILASINSEKKAPTKRK